MKWTCSAHSLLFKCGMGVWGGGGGLGQFFYQEDWEEGGGGPQWYVSTPAPSPGLGLIILATC